MKDIIVHPNMTIRHAMKVLDNTGEKCLLAVDGNNKLIGTITDGDLRRSILSGAQFSEEISNCYNTNPTTLIEKKYSDEEAKQLLRIKKLDMIPVVNEKQVVTDYVTWSKLGAENQTKDLLSNVHVIIMAGGKGTRMEPFTNILPKALIPIREKPIIEHIIERFLKVGCTDFHLTLNYKGRILKAYFDEMQPKYKVHFVDEQEPLGTAGSLRFFIDQFNHPFIVTNCDIIIKADYFSLYEFHQKGGYDVSLVASSKEYIIPYGTCELNGEGFLSHIIEKPKYDFLINTGLYILNPEMLKMIPETEFFHFTHLIEKAKNKGKKVGVYPIDEDAWIDVGQWGEYRKAVDNLEIK